MARDISVELSVEGEREFNRQLKEAQSAVKVLGSELKASEAQFKGGEDAQERYANRTRILGDQIEQERIIIERLAKAVETAGNEFGQTDAKTDKYRIALNRARENVAKMQKELEKTDREMEELGRDSVRVGRQLEDGVGESAKNASDGISQMAQALESDFKGIAVAAGISAAIDIGQAFVDVGQSIADFAESTRESRRQFSFLEQNAIDAGMDYDYILEQLGNIQPLTGDIQSSITGISNLLATDMDEQQLAKSIERLGGAVAAFPQTFTFDGLAESLRESAATGETTGQLAELMESLGIETEEVNTAMSNAGTQSGRLQVLLAYLAENGLEETYQAWKNNNKGLVEAEQAATNFELAVNGLGEAVEPIGTAFTNLATAGIKAFTDALNNTGISEWIAGALNEFTEAVNIISQEGLEAYAKHEQQERETEYKETHEAAATVDPEAVARVKELRKQLAEINAQIAAADEAGEYVKANMLMGEQSRLVNEIAEAEKAVAEAAEKAKKQAEETGEELATSMSDTTKETLTAGMTEAGTEGANAEIEAFAQGNEGMYTGAYNSMVSAADGIRAGGDLVVGATEEIAERRNRTWARWEAEPVPRRSAGSGATGGQSTGASRSMTVALNVDGRSFAKATIPYYNAQMGDSLNAIVNA